MNDILIIANPSSGKKQAKTYAEKASVILKKNNRLVDIKYTSKKSDISTFAKQASKENYRSIIVMGGDGTVSELINGLRDQKYKPTIAIIPTGTVNNIANSLNISPNPIEAVEQLLSCDEQAIDVGRINNQLFLSSASAGSIPETVWEVSDEQKKKYGSAAYFLTGLQTLNDENFYRMEMEIDGKHIECDLSLLIIGVSHSIVGIPNFFNTAAYDDGYLYLFGLKKTTIGEKLSIVPSLFLNDSEFNESQNLAFTHSFKKASISIKGNKTHLAIDGEKGPAFPVDIEVLPRFFTFLVPKTNG